MEKQDIREYIHDIFNEEGGFKDEMLALYRAENNRTMLKIFSVFGIALISSIVGFTTYLTTLTNTVQTHEEFIKSGERFTQADGELLKIQIEANTDTLKDVARSSDLLDLKESFIRLDERLRNKGI